MRAYTSFTVLRSAYHERNGRLNLIFPKGWLREFEDNAGDGSAMTDIHSPIRINIDMCSGRSIGFGGADHAVEKGLVRRSSKTRGGGKLSSET